MTKPIIALHPKYPSPRDYMTLLETRLLSNVKALDTGAILAEVYTALTAWPRQTFLLILVKKTILQAFKDTSTIHLHKEN
ncbi:hypothetical protein DPMN_159583 [Dreissena polymorpha]|uniref:Uncharacterized protein n=1 Tax=Dreissena polymorpha TaxID=45954 RepID=A0A9D4EPK3_DREPO|nr:hypothetical protein DPMN_159583 [Dreissena polymorpha]